MGILGRRREPGSEKSQKMKRGQVETLLMSLLPKEGFKYESMMWDRDPGSG